ncbi:MAG: Crp/Fnr family transcriptional regulator [Paenibacillaceae bacterium]|jgi:CRP/FNR family transcriptional regulator|nr:Crp/Fnr family transcriptional regulator [Paenibacillaceae bacterium]
MDPLRYSLADVPLFRGLDERELHKLGELLIPRLYKKKSIIFTEGSEKESIYIVRSGLVKAFKTDADGHEQIVNFLGPGSMFPHTGFFLLSPYPATTEAVMDTQLLAMPLKSFEHLLTSTPSMTIKVMRVMSETIQELQSKLQELTGQDVMLRLLSFLAAMAEKQGRVLPDGRVKLSLPVTHQELGSTIGTTRESVTRLLAQLRKEGLLEVSRGGFVITDMPRFRRWGRGDKTSD